MLTIRTVAQLRGPGTVKGFRSCVVSTGVPDVRADVHRLFRMETSRVTRERRRRWLASHWDAHKARTARSGGADAAESGR